LSTPRNDSASISIPGIPYFQKYLLETMGAGVALFDYDNNGRLDIYLVNGAPLSNSTPRGTVPQKTDSQYWNR
jgi:hypothetical protein